MEKKEKLIKDMTTLEQLQALNNLHNVIHQANAAKEDAGSKINALLSYLHEGSLKDKECLKNTK